MNETMLLGRRAVREVWRLSAATIAALFIPVFFLRSSTSTRSNRLFFNASRTPFLHGQHYVDLQIPVSLVFSGEFEDGPFRGSRWSPTSTSATSTSCSPHRSAARRSSGDALPLDLARGVAVSVIVLTVGFGLRGAGQVGRARGGAADGAVGAVGGRLRRYRHRDHPQDQERPDHQCVVPDLIPVAVPDSELVPLDLLAGPLKAIAQINPVTYVITGLRRHRAVLQHPSGLRAGPAYILAIRSSPASHSPRCPCARWPPSPTEPVTRRPTGHGRPMPPARSADRPAAAGRTGRPAPAGQDFTFQLDADAPHRTLARVEHYARTCAGLAGQMRARHRAASLAGWHKDPA